MFKLVAKYEIPRKQYLMSSREFDRSPRRLPLRSIVAGLVLLVIVEAAAIALIRVEKPVDALEYMQLSENVYRIRSFSYDGITPTRDRQPLYPLFLVVFYWSLGLVSKFGELIRNFLNSIPIPYTWLHHLQVPSTVQE